MEPVAAHAAEFDRRKRIATGLALQHDCVRSSRPQRCFKMPCLARQMAQNLTEPRNVFRLANMRKTVYRNGLRGCHFGRARVNLWKTREVSYPQTVGFSSTSFLATLGLRSGNLNGDQRERNDGYKAPT